MLKIDHKSFKEYEKVKIEAASKYSYSPPDYCDAKNDCVAKIMEKARQYYKS